MSDLFSKFDIDQLRIQSIVSDSLNGADGGELFMEYSESESLMFDNGRLKA